MASILWGGPPPPPDVEKLKRRNTNWWNQYADELGPQRRLEEVESSSLDVVGVLPDPEDWAGAPSPFKGLVVGAVQSGKTASMIGVAAVAIDQGFRIVIVLAGLKDDLRRQTARRFNRQLLRQVDEIPDTGGATTGPGRLGPGPLGGYSLPYHHDANYVPTLQVQIERALRKGEPAVLVVKKNPKSLQAVTNALSVVYRRHGSDSLPTLVLDDECDEASIPGQGDEKTVPACIVRLWEASDPTPHVAYVGYTATAAASLLQDPSSELFPSHFVKLIRHPAAMNTMLSYAIPEPDGWYTGGQTYYSAFGHEPGEDVNFLVLTDVKSDELGRPPQERASLKSALIAYLVGGAFRYGLHPDCSFDDNERLPRPHSMIVHTSVAVDEHRVWRDAAAAILHGEVQDDGVVLFDADQLIQDMQESPDEWRKWWGRLQISRSRVMEERPHTEVCQVVTWKRVLELIPVVLKNTKLKLVNSDVDGATLNFSPGVDRHGNVTAPDDVYVHRRWGIQAIQGVDGGGAVRVLLHEDGSDAV